MTLTRGTPCVYIYIYIYIYIHTHTHTHTYVHPMCHSVMSPWTWKVIAAGICVDINNNFVFLKTQYVWNCVTWICACVFINKNQFTHELESSVKSKADSYSSGELTLILRRSRTGTVWFYASTSNKRAARPKLYTKSLTRDLKRMYSRFTLVRISINL